MDFHYIKKVINLKRLIKKAERDSRCEILVEGAKQITEVGLDAIKEAYEALNNNMTREEVDTAYKKLKSAIHSIEYSWSQLAKNSDLFDTK
jgi:F0F1-type ATP synthase epsilon subunit